MKVVFFSNKGAVREHNEDALLISGNIISGCSMTSPAENNTENENNCFIVIDGMGGYEGGEKAARIIASSFIENSVGWNILIKEAQYKINLILNSAVKKIADAVSDKLELSAMGAALAGIVFCNDKALFLTAETAAFIVRTGSILKNFHMTIQSFRNFLIMAKLTKMK